MQSDHQYCLPKQDKLKEDSVCDTLDILLWDVKSHDALCPDVSYRLEYIEIYCRWKARDGKKERKKEGQSVHRFLE